jgi:DNA mismatch endonuclease (patch repair protein)
MTGACRLLDGYFQPNDERMKRARRNKRRTTTSKKADASAVDGKRRPLTRAEIMRRVKGKNSAAELALRSALHAEGLRFRLHRRVERVAVDIVFAGPRVATFVDGCFWHGCPKHATYPKTNRDYWLPKLAENRARDRKQTTRLRKAEWTVIRVWGHDCLPPKTGVITRIVDACRTSPGGRP